MDGWIGIGVGISIVVWSDDGGGLAFILSLSNWLADLIDSMYFMSLYCILRIVSQFRFCSLFCLENPTILNKIKLKYSCCNDQSIHGII